MKHWKPSMKDLLGNLKHSQDLCNQFSLEIARGELLTPPVFPYVVPDLSRKPWAIQEPAHVLALQNWQKLQKPHKRPGAQDVSINQWFLYNLRYILAGDLAGAWSPFGGLAAQMSHIGIVLDLAVTEHSGVALSYDLQIKNLAKQMAETDREKNKAESLLSDLNQTVKNNVLRDFGIMPTYTSVKSRAPKGEKDKGKGDKGKGKHRKGDKRKPRETTWGKNGQPPNLNQTQQQPGQGQQQHQTQRGWYNDWGNNDWAQSKPDEPPPAEQQQEQGASQKTIAMKNSLEIRYYPLYAPPFILDRSQPSKSVLLLCVGTPLKERGAYQCVDQMIKRYQSLSGARTVWGEKPLFSFSEYHRPRTLHIVRNTLLSSGLGELSFHPRKVFRYKSRKGWEYAFP